MTQRVAPEGVARKQHDIYGQDKCSNTDAEFRASGLGIQKPKGTPNIHCENDQKHQRKIQKIAMNILQD
jgi:hypothetical protein